ncbi:MAG: hypothetical protein AB1384_14795 [Actinomycetota bacterium]
MLAEFALTPDFFDPTSYSSDEIHGLHLRYLKDTFLKEALIRDLREGKWEEYVLSRGLVLSPKSKELLKKMRQQNRLRLVPSAREADPINDREWCEEAIQSHSIDPLDGIIATDKVKKHYIDEDIVASVDRLNVTQWWRLAKETAESTTVLVNTSSYKKALKKIFECARSIMFIDPWIDPREDNYSHFGELLALSRRDAPPNPLIEIHRKVESPRSRVDVKREVNAWEQAFSSLDNVLQDTGNSAEVFIWDYVHDRFLVTDIIGISIGQGFSESRYPGETTKFSRLSRSDRDDLQREYHENSKKHWLVHKFRIGA